MKLVKGKLFKIILHEYEFFVLTSNVERAHIFYTTVFPAEVISIADIHRKTIIFTKDSLRAAFIFVKKTWETIGLLKTSPGDIKFNRVALDMLLEQNEIILTNI